MELEHPEAFDPFFDETAVVTGKRKDAGAAAARNLKLKVPCCVVGGAKGEVLNGAGSETVGNVFSVIVRRSEWPDRSAPQEGDTVTIEGYSEMGVERVGPLVRGEWRLVCKTRE